jgi:hypothetical protein
VNPEKQLDFSDAILSGGTGRSGTTIVGKLLTRHSKICISRPTEIKVLTSGNGLLDLHLGRKVGKYKRLLVTDGLHLYRFKQRLYKEWWTRDIKISPNRPEQKPGTQVGLRQAMDLEELDELFRELKEEFKIDKTHATQSFLRGLINIHKERSEKPIWIDTTPINILRSREINSFLPGIRFIHMVRDGRDAISSVIREPWGPNNFDDGLKWWRGRMIKNLRGSLSVGEKMLTLALEDLAIHNRESSYTKLLNFAGISDEERIRDFFDEKVRPENVRQGRWEKEVDNPREFDTRYREIVAELKEIDPSVPLYL